MLALFVQIYFKFNWIENGKWALTQNQYVCLCKYTERWIVEMNRRKKILKWMGEEEKMGQSNGKEDDHKNKKFARLTEEMGRK